MQKEFHFFRVATICIVVFGLVFHLVWGGVLAPAAIFVAAMVLGHYNIPVHNHWLLDTLFVAGAMVVAVNGFYLFPYTPEAVRSVLIMGVTLYLGSYYLWRIIRRFPAMRGVIHDSGIKERKEMQRLWATVAVIGIGSGSVTGITVYQFLTQFCTGSTLSLTETLVSAITASVVGIGVGVICAIGCLIGDFFAFWGRHGSD